MSVSNKMSRKRIKPTQLSPLLKFPAVPLESPASLTKSYDVAMEKRLKNLKKKKKSKFEQIREIYAEIERLEGELRELLKIE